MLRINSFYQKIQPQTILEEIINFSLQGEIFFDDEYHCNRFAIIPYGNWLYTGAIQALGIHYLNTTKVNKIIMITGSSSITKSVITQEKRTEPIMGKSLYISQSLQKEFDGITKTNSILISKNKAITSQLPFIRTLSDLEIFPIIVPAKDYDTNLEKTLKKIVKKDPLVGIICITNHEYTTNKKNIETQDKKIINKLTSHTKAHRQKNTAHIQLFYNIVKTEGKNLQLVLYTNTANSKNTKTTSHYCMVG